MVRVTMKRSAWVGTVFVQTLLALPCGAQELSSLRRAGNLTLRWSAPAGCPNAEVIVREIERIAGPMDNALPLSANAEVTRHSSESWSVSLTTQMAGSSGERALHGENCEEVARAAALVLALMTKIQPAPEEQSSTPRSAPETRTPVKKERKRAPQLPPHGELRVGTSVGAGLLPKLAAGLDLHGVLAWEYWAAEVRLGGWLPSFATAPEPPPGATDVVASDGAGGYFWMLEASVAACLRLPIHKLRFDTCGAAGLTRMYADGEGVEQTRSATALFGSVILEQGVALPLGPLHLRLAAQASTPLSRPRFNIEQLGTVHRPARFGWRGVLAAELDF